MRDVLEFESPWGVLGKAVDALILTRHLARLLLERNGIVQRAAESGVESRGAN